MPLELKDLQTQKSMTVPEEGFTFGREGGDANVLLRDTGVSKRHARVFGENGAWFLEDLGSSNGTWLQKERIKDATELLPGDVFQLSQAKFEVLQVLPGDRDATNAAPKTMNEMPVSEEQEDDSASAAPAPKPSAGSAPKPGPKLPQKDPSVSKSKPVPAPVPPAGKKVEAKSKRGEAPTAIGPESPMPTDAGAGPGDSGGGAAGAEAKGVGYFLIAVPKAAAFYMAALPVMLVNPVGTIRKGVEEQKHEAKGRMELIAYALPAYLLMAAFGFLGSLIVGLVTHTLSIGSILPIGPLIGAVISSVVVGFVWHPLLNWWVNFLKGTSDDRSRTNYFMLFMTALALTALPTFVATVLSLVHLPLIGLVPLVLRLGASLITLFVSYSWFKAAGVVKWFQIVLLVLGGLACLGTLAGIPAAISGSGGSVTVASAGGDADAQIAAAQKMAEDAQKQADAAQADAQKQLADATKQVAAATDEAQKDIKKATDQAQKAAEKTGKAAEKTAEKVAEKAAEVEKTVAPPAPPTPGKAEVPVATGAGYAAWRTKYDAIEKRVSDDPTVLSKNPAIRDLYKALEEDVSEIENKYQKATKKASEKRLNEHLKDAEMYEKTEKRVIELHGKLFH